MYQRFANVSVLVTFAGFLCQMPLHAATSPGGGNATVPAPVAQEDESGPALEEVIITAEKRPERLADTPVSATVLSESRLADDNTGDISELSKLVPSVNINGTLSQRSPMGIRGVSSVLGAVGISSGVAVQVDGVPIPSDSFAGNQVEDVENVEVLKGPQATLGGRTAASGVINYVTHQPTDSLHGSVSATMTDDNEQRFSGYISGPIEPGTVDMSLSGYVSHRDYPMVNLATKENTGEDVFGTRVKMLIRPSDDLNITLAAHVQEMKSSGSNLVYGYLTPGATLLFPGSPLTQQALLTGVTPSFSNIYYNSPVTRTGSQFIDGDVSATINYKIGAYDLTSTTAYQHEYQDLVQDLFLVDEYFWNIFTGGHAPPFSNIQQTWEHISQTSEELKLTSPTTDRINFVTGIYYSDTRIGQEFSRALLPAEQISSVTPDTATYDAYGRVNWGLVAGTTLVTGLRFNHDEIKYSEIQRINAPEGAFASAGSHSNNVVVGDVTLKQQILPGWIAYATYARGYSPGAYNTNIALASNAPLVPVGEEKINHFELGSKGEFFDRRLSVDVALFETIYNNFQVESFQIEPGFINAPLVLSAAGKAQTRGLEMDLIGRPTQNLTASMNIALIDAVFKQYNDAACYGDQSDAQGCRTDPVTGQRIQNVSGSTLPNAPKFKANFALEQRVPISASPFELSFRADYSYRTSAEMLPDQNPYAVFASYGILNASAGLHNEAYRYTITFFVNNALNKHYNTDAEDFFSSVWSNTNAILVQPARDSFRYAGVRASKEF
jgi:iron complex outermembrane receptor protein